MFNLETAITDWRRQMLAAGIKTPDHLDELESHLREEIGRQMKGAEGEAAGVSRPPCRKSGGQKRSKLNLPKSKPIKRPASRN